MIKFICSILCSFLFFLILTFTLTSCNPDGEDTSELWKKSNTRGDIVARSGTTLRAGTNKNRMREQMQDAENRLRTGGGLFGKKPIIIGGITLI